MHQPSEDKMTALFAFLSPMTVAILALIGVILFGKRLPEVGRSLGKTITEFKKGMKGLEDEIDVMGNHSSPVAQAQHNPAPPEAIRPPQRVAATAPKFEDAPVNPP